MKRGYNSVFSVFRLWAIAVCAGLAAALPVPSVRADPAELQSLTEEIAADYATISHIDADEFQRLRAANRDNVVVVDVRESEEFAVSHLDGALRIDPGSWNATVLRKLGDIVRGRDVVFYCSVGVRSSKMAENVKSALMASGAKGVHNLRGGVFAWHNQSRPLVNARGATDKVHPYDSYWGRLLAHPARASAAPNP